PDVVRARIECSVASSRGDRVMAKHIEDLSQFLQSFGVAPLALLLLPVLITALARNVILALATSLLSFASLMLFVAPASATSGLAIVSGLGSFLVALESVVARGRMMALNKEIADLTSRVNRLERAEQRRLTLEIKASGHHATKTEPSPSLTPPSPERVHCALSTSLSDTIAQCLNLEREIHHTASKLRILASSRSHQSSALLRIPSG